MNKTFPSLTAAALIGLSATASAEDPLRIGVDVPTAPMEYRLPSGELTGFDIDLGNALCELISRETGFILARLTPNSYLFLHR